jgi:hypothetical protein
VPRRVLLLPISRESIVVLEAQSEMTPELRGGSVRQLIVGVTGPCLGPEVISTARKPFRFREQHFHIAGS